MISLDGRVAIVTGGVRGLGRAMTDALLAAGARVFVIARSADQVADAVSQLELAAPGRAAGMSADVSRLADCQAVLARMTKVLGPPDVLVNNAAVGLGSFPGDASVNRIRPFHTVAPEAVETMLRVNLLGAFNMYQTMVPGMIQRGFGRIVGISTSRPTMRRPNVGPYGPIKAALEAATHIWAQELAGTGVTANILLPGGISDTGLVAGGDPGTRAKPFSAGKGPLGLEGRSMDLLPPYIMGPPIVWLASDRSAATSGRRFVARDWDPDLPQDEAAARAMQAPSEAPVIM